MLKDLRGISPLRKAGDLQEIPTKLFTVYNKLN